MSLTKTDKTFFKSLIKPLDKRVGSLENKTDVLDKKIVLLDKKIADKTDVLGKKTDNLTKRYLLLSNRVERGFKEVTENQAKFRNETLNGFDQVLTEIKEMRQEKEVMHYKVYKDLDPRVTKLELSQTAKKIL